MNIALFEPRPLYGIGTVARLTGLKPDTLRVWERRYGLGASHKTTTGRRQYTQSDLEHLQLIATLVSGGARIGEIAKSDRKTLEHILRQRGAPVSAVTAKAKSRAVFVGASLCEWIDRHQGCISNIDARLARKPLTEIPDEIWSDLGELDILVVESAALANSVVALLSEIKSNYAIKNIIVCCQYSNERWIEQLEGMGIVSLSLPPDSGRLAFEIAKCAVADDVGLGEENLGDVLPVSARKYSAHELSAAAHLYSTLDCECPRHISELITALANFEEYSASCEIENWGDAATHACVYAYTARARVLMEKSLTAVLEDRQQEFQEQLRLRRRSNDDGLKDQGHTHEGLTHAGFNNVA